MATFADTTPSGCADKKGRQNRFNRCSSGERKSLIVADPAATPKLRADGVAPKEGGNPKNSSVVNRPRVLIVDDNADAANSLGRLLSLLGKEVAVAHDGPSAVQVAARFMPHLALLDLGMPGMDGIETAKHIQALPQGNRIKLVALTGWGQEGDRQRTEAAGFAAHLVKPVQVDQLENLLDKLAP
jgi:CheY-like chemotaxis protein